MHAGINERLTMELTAIAPLHFCTPRRSAYHISIACLCGMEVLPLLTLCTLRRKQITMSLLFGGVRLRVQEAHFPMDVVPEWPRPSKNV